MSRTSNILVRLRNSSRSPHEFAHSAVSYIDKFKIGNFHGRTTGRQRVSSHLHEVFQIPFNPRRGCLVLLIKVVVHYLELQHFILDPFSDMVNLLDDVDDGIRTDSPTSLDNRQAFRVSLSRACSRGLNDSDNRSEPATTSPPKQLSNWMDDDTPPRHRPPISNLSTPSSPKSRLLVQTTSQLQEEQPSQSSPLVRIGPPHFTTFVPGLRQHRSMSQQQRPPPHSLGLLSRVSPRNYHEAPLPLRSSTPTPSDNVAASFASLSSLAAARFIEDLRSVQYPDAILSPSMELNMNTRDGKFRYDRDFLLQFKTICTNKPPSLRPLDAIGLQSSDQTSYSESMTWRGSSFRSQSFSSSPPASGQAFAGLSFRKNSGFNKPSPMDLFATTRVDAKMSSASQDQGENAVNSPSQRGDHSGYTNSGAMAQSSLGLEVVVRPLQQSANRWDRKAFAVHPESPAMVERKVRGLLNKLTEKTFDSVSDEIIECAIRSDKDHDDTLVIRLIFEMLDDRAWLMRLYACMCQKMMKKISTKVQGDGDNTKDPKGVAPTGSRAFHEHLFQRCMKDFKKHWISKTTTTVALVKAPEDEMAKDTDHKAKRQAFGLLNFMGQLFDLRMLGIGRAMFLCMEMLLGEVNNPEERKLKGLCTLLATAGQRLDRLFRASLDEKGRIDACFSRIEELRHNANISPRIRFMLQDVIMMRKCGWPKVEELWNIYAYDRAASARIRRLMDDCLTDDSDSDEEVVIPKSGASKSRIPRSEKPSIDLSRTRTPQEEAWRLKLLHELLAEIEEHEERGAMDEKEATKKILDDVDELSVMRDLDAAEAYFSGLPTMYHPRLVNRLVSSAIESAPDEASATMVAGLFTCVALKKLCSSSAFEEGFLGIARSLDDIAIDVPQAWAFMGIMVDGACPNEEYQRRRIMPYQMWKYYLRSESSF